MKRIILTGGGTAGHVTPNIALLPRLKELGYDIHYIGSYTGIEKELIEQFDIPYHGISSGKLRRYFDWKNFTDPFRVLKGFQEANKLIKTLNFNLGQVFIVSKFNLSTTDIDGVKYESGTIKVEAAKGVVCSRCWQVVDEINED